MDTPSLVAILRDMEAGRRNVLGDHWHSSYAGTAASVLESLDAENKQLREELKAARAETQDKQIYHPPCRY